MITRNYVVASLVGLAVVVAASSFQKPQDSNKVKVRLCDGETTTEVAASETKTQAGGQAIANKLMAAWLAKHPGRWKMPAQGNKAQQDPDAIIEKRHKIMPPYDNSALLGKGQSEGDTYGNFTKRDLMIWERETKKMVVHGARVFHNAKLLGSTISVSCDMCHPDASNTHPETYPKYQTQIGKAVLLRDMINWCLEHPVRAKPMAEDDPRLRAMEAYIYAQRKGKVLQYNRH